MPASEISKGGGGSNGDVLIAKRLEDCALFVIGGDDAEVEAVQPRAEGVERQRTTATPPPCAWRAGASACSAEQANLTNNR
jgi:hypothetical protein